MPLAKTKEYTLRKYTQKQYLSDLKNEIKENGLQKSIQKRCDEINHLCKPLGYIEHRSVQEQLVEILDLIKIQPQ